MKFLKKINTALSEATGRIFNSITSSTDKTKNAPSIQYAEWYVKDYTKDMNSLISGFFTNTGRQLTSLDDMNKLLIPRCV